MDSVMKKAVKITDRLNETYIEVKADVFREVCRHLYEDLHAILRVLFAADERQKDGCFRIYAVFTVPGTDRFSIVVLSLPQEETSFPSITAAVPAAHWYEREIMDLFGLAPRGHPDTRRLVFHEAFLRPGDF